jgi:hypothetical protein
MLSLDEVGPPCFVVLRDSSEMMEGYEGEVGVQFGS